MWFFYLIAVVACAALLYIPGYCLARAVPLSRFASVAVAPMLSTLFFTVAGIAAFELVRPCHPWALVAAVTALCVVALIARHAFGSKAEPLAQPDLASKDLLRLIALYVTVAVVLFFLVYLLNIDGAYSFSRNDDSTVHLGITRGFLDTGTFSTLHANSFLDQELERFSFYPAAWHVICALTASFSGGSIPLAFNASITVFLVLVFPIGMLFLFEKVFRGKKPIIIAGSLMTLAFCGFPWGYIVWGQLLPNMASFIFVPVALTVFAFALDAKQPSTKAKLLTVVVLGFASIAFCQPNGVFTLGILVVLYAISRIFYAPDAAKAVISAKRIVGAAALFAAACCVWFAMYKMPFMQAVVNTTWSASLSPFEALVSSPLFMFSVRQGVQPLLTLLTVVGIVYACRERRYLWLAVAYLAALAFHILGTATDGPLKHLLIGFWYTDYNRTGAMCALFAIPIASMGLARIALWLKALLQKKRPGKAAAWYTGSVIVVVAMVFALLQLMPVHVQYKDRNVYLSLASISSQVHSRYSWESTLTTEEDAFIREAMDEVLPEGAMVINVPSDGSCWSYGVEGINTFFRRSSNTGSRWDADEANLIRTRLNKVATDQEVQDKLKELDAHYLLMLDDPSSDHPTKTSQRYKPEDWAGIESIDESTPGFKLLLSEGDMRLYEITAVE